MRKYLYLPLLAIMVGTVACEDGVFEDPQLDLSEGVSAYVRFVEDDDVEVGVTDSTGNTVSFDIEIPPNQLNDVEVTYEIAGIEGYSASGTGTVPAQRVEGSFTVEIPADALGADGSLTQVTSQEAGTITPGDTTFETSIESITAEIIYEAGNPVDTMYDTVFVTNIVDITPSDTVFNTVITTTGTATVTLTSATEGVSIGRGASSEGEEVDPVSVNLIITQREFQ